MERIATQCITYGLYMLSTVWEKKQMAVSLIHVCRSATSRYRLQLRFPIRVIHVSYSKEWDICSQYLR